MADDDNAAATLDPTPIMEAHASGEEIFQVVGRIEEAVGGCPREHVIMACMAISVVMQNPMLSEDQLHDAIKGMSQWLCMYLSALENNSVDVPWQTEPSEELKKRLN